MEKLKSETRGSLRADAIEGFTGRTGEAGEAGEAGDSGDSGDSGCHFLKQVDYFSLVDEIKEDSC